MHQYFIASLIIEELRQTVETARTRAQWRPPVMHDAPRGVTWDTFVRHISESGEEEITKKKRRHVFQWRGHNLLPADDESFENDMGEE